MASISASSKEDMRSSPHAPLFDPSSPATFGLSSTDHESISTSRSLAIIVFGWIFYIIVELVYTLLCRCHGFIAQLFRPSTLFDVPP